MPDAVQIGSPLRRAFAHNDYARERPLYDALEHGFTAIEVDVFLEEGQLLVGHGTRDLLPIAPSRASTSTRWRNSSRAVDTSGTTGHSPC